MTSLDVPGALLLVLLPYDWRSQIKVYSKVVKSSKMLIFFIKVPIRQKIGKFVKIFLYMCLVKNFSIFKIVLKSLVRT